MKFVDCYYKPGPGHGITISPNEWSCPNTVSVILADVVALYLRDEDMEVDELERMVDVAVRGGIPDNPRLRYRVHIECEAGSFYRPPGRLYYLPMAPMATGMETHGELR